MSVDDLPQRLRLLLESRFSVGNTILVPESSKTVCSGATCLSWAVVRGTAQRPAVALRCYEQCLSPGLPGTRTDELFKLCARIRGYHVEGFNTRSRCVLGRRRPPIRSHRSDLVLAAAYEQVCCWWAPASRELLPTVVVNPKDMDPV